MFHFQGKRLTLAEQVTLGEELGKREVCVRVCVGGGRGEVGVWGVGCVWECVGVCGSVWVYVCVCITFDLFTIKKAGC